MCPELKEKNNSTNSSTASNFDCSQEVLLKTIMVYINAGPKKILARILFDDGSQRSYITSALVKSINSIPFRHEYIRNILFDGTRTSGQKFNNHKVNITELEGTNVLPVILRERPTIGGRIPRIPKGSKNSKTKELNSTMFLPIKSRWPIST